MLRQGTNTPEQPQVPPMPSMAAEFDRLYLEKCKEVNELEQKIERYKKIIEIAVKQRAELENKLNGQKALLHDQREQLEAARQTIKELESMLKDSNELLEDFGKQLDGCHETIREMQKSPLTGDLIPRGAALKAVSDANSTIIVLPELPADRNEGILSQIQKRYNRALELIEAIPAVSSDSTIRELAAEPLKAFTPDVEPPEELPEALMEELPLWALQPVTSQDILCLSSALKNLYDIHKCDSWLLYNKLAKVLEKRIEEYCGED